jgi:hypothetical protein
VVPSVETSTLVMLVALPVAVAVRERLRVVGMGEDPLSGPPL